MRVFTRVIKEARLHSEPAHHEVKGTACKNSINNFKHICIHVCPNR